MAGKDMWAAVQYHPRYNDRDSVCGYYRHELKRFDFPEEAEFFIGEIFEGCNFDTDDIYYVEYLGPVGPVQGCENIDLCPF
jgi:hypothetical protein